MTPSVGLCAQLACLWEATARKPGNVHRFRDFDDASYVDFLTSAAAIAPVLERAADRPIGHTVLEAVRATRAVTATNTNLGVVLLLTPLAAVPRGDDVRSGIQHILASLDVSDARAVYEAIRLAAPAGLGRVAEQDVRTEPTLTLRQVMELAAERDLVARQYARGYFDLFLAGVPALRSGLEQAGTLEGAIVFCHVLLLALNPDSLIARKRGRVEAEEASSRAEAVLQAGPPQGEAFQTALRDLDEWLRAEGRGRNPGTTADLVTACLFVALRDGSIPLPPPWPWTRPDAAGK
jgi:triphosphoribosyl-dephospho-CoA synthase